MINEILYFILLYSNFIIFATFFFMIAHLIKCSEIFEKKDKDIKVRIGKLDRKVEYGSLILSILAGGFLFKIIPLILYEMLKFIPMCPILDLINILYSILPEMNMHLNYNPITSINDLKNYPKNEQIIILGMASAAFLFFLLAILSIYYTVFKKIVIDNEIKGLKYIIGYTFLSILFGLLFMLRLIALS